jgi:hypothetical protein
MPLIFSAIFLIKLKITQYRAEEKLEQSVLQTLVLTEDKFKWLRKNKEISIDGKLFDIKSFSEKNGEYIFKGIFDEEETALAQILSKSFNDNNLDDELPGLFQILLSVSTLKSAEPAITCDVSMIYCPLILQHISSPFQDILTPPPQLVLTYYS